MLASLANTKEDVRPLITSLLIISSEEKRGTTYPVRGKPTNQQIMKNVKRFEHLIVPQDVILSSDS